MVTPLRKEKLIRHELIGLHVNVIHSSNPTHIGIRGKVIDETKNMLMISNGVKNKWIQKDLAIYRFTFPDKSFVDVEGKKIQYRPVHRIKKALKRRFR